MTSRAKTKPRDNSQKDPMAFAKAWALVLFSGMLISIYTVMLRQAALRAGSQECVRSAAIYVANDLRKLSLTDPAFGAVGLCDTDIDEGNARVRITSINRLYATLRLDDIISKRLQLPGMARMVASDFDQVRRLDEQLRQKMAERITTIYQHAYAIAGQSNRAHEKLVALRIKLGSEDSREFQSGMPAITMQGEHTSNSWSVNGRYAAGVDVPISGGSMARFYQLANESRFVDQSKFREAKSGMTPSVVLVEAEYDMPTKKRLDVRITRRAAIMLGGADTTSAGSVLVVGFPQGMPKPFHSFRALISSSSTGTYAWQQASDGDVPGQGHLSLSNYRFDGSSEMGTKEAIQVAFYHWVRSLGPALNVASVAKLFDSSWSTANVRSLENTGENPFPAGPNSALTKDTGSRARAFFFQTGPGGDGQRVLKAAFEAQPNQQSLPNSAVPLDIDESGNCNLPGHTGLDRKLVADLLEAVYETNIASNESLGLAKSIINRMERAEDQTQRTIDVANEELRSISTRKRGIPTNKEAAPELNRVQISEANLTAQINAEDARLSEYRKIHSRAQTVLSNAESAAQASFDLCANMLNYAGEGLFRARDGKSFLLGGVYIFHPISHSVTEDEIYKGTNEKSLWISPLLNVLEAAPEREALEAKVERNQSASSEENRAMPRFAIFDSRELIATNPQLLVLDRSPFGDTGVPVGQLAYYAPNALITGDNPPVGWSLLVRDAIANRTMGGAPLRSRFSQWCLGQSHALSECPGMAVELLVRSPAPIMPELPVGSYVVSPQNHDRVSQIPPTPPDML